MPGKKPMPYSKTNSQQPTQVQGDSTQANDLKVTMQGAFEPALATTHQKEVEQIERQAQEKMAATPDENKP